MMNIALLADHTKVIPTLVDWYRLEWEPYYGADGLGDARVDLESRCNRDALPIGLVALEGDQALGTVALDLDTATNLTPSVVGLLVGSEHRGRGIATALIESATSLAMQLGCGRLYVSTTALGNLLLRMGWQLFGEAEFLNDERGSVYVCDLNVSHQ